MTDIKTPPGTVPLMIHWPTRTLHVVGEFRETHWCNPDFCRRIGFRVVDADRFEAWRKENENGLA